LPIAAHTLAGGALISIDSRTFWRVGPCAQAIPITASAVTTAAAFAIVALMSFPHFPIVLLARADTGCDIVAHSRSKKGRFVAAARSGPISERRALRVNALFRASLLHYRFHKPVRITANSRMTL
jgi:hypothetical protein